MFTDDEERALLLTLRDARDGRLTMWIDPSQYDMVIGLTLGRSEILRILPNREPAAGVPDRDGAWWMPLVLRSWVASHVTAGRPYLRVADPGLRVLREAGL